MTPVTTTSTGIPAIAWLILSIVGVAASLALRMQEFPLDSLVRLAISSLALLGGIKWMTRCHATPVTAR